MKTKAYVLFLNRAAQFEADIELADVLSKMAMAQKPSPNSKLFHQVEETKHPRLSKRKANEHNRMLACKHLNTTVRVGYIKDLYEELGHYMTAIIRACAKKGISGDRLIGAQKIEIDANSLLGLGSWEAVIDHVSEKIFRSLENLRSTQKMIVTFGAKLDLKFDNAVIEAALPYLEMRHLLVHRDGKVDDEFAAKHPQLGLKSGDEFTLSYQEITKAREAVAKLIEHIDHKVVDHGLAPTSELQK